MVYYYIVIYIKIYAKNLKNLIWRKNTCSILTKSSRWYVWQKALTMDLPPSRRKADGYSLRKSATYPA